jgi:hypothetical protein
LALIAQSDSQISVKFSVLALYPRSLSKGCYRLVQPTQGPGRRADIILSGRILWIQF